MTCEVQGHQLVDAFYVGKDAHRGSLSLVLKEKEHRCELANMVSSAYAFNYEKPVFCPPRGRTRETQVDTSFT